MKTTGFPNSTSTSPKFLKLRQINFVSIFSPRYRNPQAKTLHDNRHGTVSPSERSPAHRPSSLPMRTQAIPALLACLPECKEISHLLVEPLDEKPFVFERTETELRFPDNGTAVKAFGDKTGASDDNQAAYRVAVTPAYRF